MPPLNPTSSSSTPPSFTATAAAPATKVGVRRRSSVPAASALHSGPSRDPCVLLSWKERQKRIQCRIEEALSSGPSRAIAPIAIIGGTFSVYSSAIKLSNNNNSANATELTPISILYLLLLALNYAVMPRLSKRYIHPSTNKQSVALVEEVVKMSLGMGGWVLTSYVASRNGIDIVSTDANAALQPSAHISTASVLSQQLQNWSPLSTLLAAGLPSALYALQGTLTYTAYQNLDAVTFNGLTQLKVLSSALCCYVVLGKRQSGMQLLSLALLMASTVVFQGSWKDWLGSSSKLKQNESKMVVGTATAESNGNRRLLVGVLPCLAATLLSGLAGAFSQRSLQTQVGMMHRDAYFYTVEISFLSAACLVLSMGIEWGRDLGARKREDNGNLKSSTSFFQHWNYATMLPIATKATAGLLTALVHRHLGSVIKGFALVLGLVFSALLQFVTEGADLTGGQLVGTALVLLSSWLHFTNPVKG